MDGEHVPPDTQLSHASLHLGLSETIPGARPDAVPGYGGHRRRRAERQHRHREDGDGGQEQDQPATGSHWCAVVLMGTDGLLAIGTSGHHAQATSNSVVRASRSWSRRNTAAGRCSSSNTMNWISSTSASAKRTASRTVLPSRSNNVSAA